MKVKYPDFDPESLLSANTTDSGLDIRSSGTLEHRELDGFVSITFETGSGRRPTGSTTDSDRTTALAGATIPDILLTGIPHIPPSFPSASPICVSFKLTAVPLLVAAIVCPAPGARQSGSATTMIMSTCP